MAGRYATALFELALDGDVIDPVASDLARLQAMIDDSGDLRRLIESPVFSRDEQSRAMDAVLEKAGISGLVRNLVGVVAANRRLFALETMISAYRALLSRHRGEVEAEIITAMTLSDAQSAALEEALRQSLGANVAITTEVDPELLGGMVVRVGSLMVDSSLSSKLERLQLAMKGAA